MQSEDFSGYYSDCRVCPNQCRTNRLIRINGRCHSGIDCAVAAVCVHRGEEPVISGRRGICNVFFAHCNMRCVYCQNYAISRYPCETEVQILSIEEIAEKIIQNLSDCDNRAGFVSPSHYVPHVAAIVDAVREKGFNPVFVYNSNGYDSVEMLRMLEGRIDVYLPDFKYSDASVAERLSGVKDYPQAALCAIREMYRQKGSPLLIDDATGLAEAGLIIRHLVLPGMVEQSIAALRMIADAISPNVHVSLMAQYYPPFAIDGFHELNRRLTAAEYARVVDAFFDLGFSKGWTQEPESAETYRPRVGEGRRFEFE